MDLKQFVLDFLSGAGGNSTYPALHAATEYQYRRELPSVLKQLRKAGVTGEVVEVTPEGNVHKIWLVSGS